MKIDTSVLLTQLAARAQRHQGQLQEHLKVGHAQLGRALGRSGEKAGSVIQ